MTRFRQANDRTIPFSEIKPERFEPARLLDPADPHDKRKLDEMRRAFMEDAPLPEEIEAERPRQLRGNR
jgi:hypothetical protein